MKHVGIAKGAFKICGRILFGQKTMPKKTENLKWGEAKRSGKRATKREIIQFPV